MSELKVKGIISEVAKKEKSYKVVVGGHNFYCKSDLSHLVGKEIESEYTLSEPYDFKGKQVQSKFFPDIAQIAVLTGSGASTPPTPNKTPINGSYPPPNAGKEVPQDVWDKKDRLMVRMSAWKDVCDVFKTEPEKDIEKMKKLAHAIEHDVYRGFEEIEMGD